MSSWWSRIRERIRPTPTVTEKVTTPEVKRATPSPTEPTKIETVTPSETTTTYSGTVADRPPTGGGRRTTTPTPTPRPESKPASSLFDDRGEAISPAEADRRIGATTTAQQVQIKGDPTVTRKVSTPSMTAVSGSRLDDPYVRTGFLSATGESARILGRNIGTFFTGRTHEYEKVTEPFSQFGKEKRDTIIPGMTRRGTVMDDQTPFVTYGEVARDVEVQDSLKEFKVRSQAIKDLEAGKDFEAINKQYQKDISKIRTESRLTTDPQLAGLYERPAQQQLRNIADVGKVVGTVGAFAVSPALGTGILIGSGVRKITKTPDRAEAFTDWQGSLRVTDEGRIVADDTALSKEYKAMRTSGGLTLLAGAVGGVGMTYKAGRDITAGRIAEGMKSPVVSSTRQLDNMGITISKQQRYGYDLFQKTQYGLTPGKGGLQVGTGTGKTTIRYLDFMKEGTGQYAWVSRTDPFAFGGRTAFGSMKGLSLTRDGVTTTRVGDSLGSFNAQAMKGYVVRGDQLTGFKTGGFSKPIGEKGITITRSGKVRSLRYYPTTGEKTVIADIKDFGIIKPGFTGMPKGELGGFGGGIGGEGGGIIGGGGFKASVRPIGGYTGGVFKPSTPPVTKGLGVSPGTGVSAKPIPTTAIPKANIVQQNIGGGLNLQQVQHSGTFQVMGLQTQTQQMPVFQSGLVQQATMGLTVEKTRAFSSPAILFRQPIQQLQYAPAPGLQYQTQQLQEQKLTFASPIELVGAKLQVGTRQRYAFPIPQAQPQTQVQKLKLLQLMAPAPAFAPAILPFTPLKPWGAKGGFWKPRLPLGDAGLTGLGRIKATRKYKYTPSFGALATRGDIFKVGFATKKRFTGLEERRTKKKKKEKEGLFRFPKFKF